MASQDTNAKRIISSATSADSSIFHLNARDTDRFDAALAGHDNWRPNDRLLRTVERFKKAIAEGVLKTK